MWDWYNRPGGIRRVPTWKLGLIFALLAVGTTVILWLFYAALAPLVLRPVPR